jgi:type IV secretion system protein VirB8
MAESAVRSKRWAAYLAEAQSFDDDRVQRYRRSEKRAWRVAAGAVLVGVLGVASAAALAPLKTVLPPVVVQVDRSTGAVDVLTTLNGQKQVPVEDAERKYWLGRYVDYRERFIWGDREANFHAVSIMSDKLEQQRYSDWFGANNPNSPQRVYTDQSFVEIHILSVALGNTPGASANVRFERIVHDRTGNKKPPERLIATVSYNFSDGPLKEADRFINPRGFQATAYRVDPEVAR